MTGVPQSQTSTSVSLAIEPRSVALPSLLAD